jgi:hypothetical protein
MNNWCICWVFTHILLGILIFKGLTARRLYKSFGVKGLIFTSARTSNLNLSVIIFIFFHSVYSEISRNIFFCNAITFENLLYLFFFPFARKVFLYYPYTFHAVYRRYWTQNGVWYSLPFSRFVSHNLNVHKTLFVEIMYSANCFS